MNGERGGGRQQRARQIDGTTPTRHWRQSRWGRGGANIGTRKQDNQTLREAVSWYDAVALWSIEVSRE